MSDTEFVQRSAAEETWRIFRIMAEFVEGVEEMAQIGPAVAVFGSARTPADTPLYEQAVELGRRLAEQDFAVITGGGPGIMEAANKGAFEAGGRSVGLNIWLPMEQEANPYQNVSIEFHYFFVRKVMFLKNASAVICFPGGFGTMDEFFESMTLLQTHKSPPMQVVLVGTEFWRPLVAWLEQTMLTAYQNISPSDLKLFMVTDSVEEAVAAVVEAHAAAQEVASEAAEQRYTVEGTVVGRPPAGRRALRKKQP